MLLKGLKKIIPPILIDIIRFFRQKKKDDIEWRGDYASWQEASENSGGYDAENILYQCKTALIKVKNGETVYERDGFIFDKIQYSWAVLALLQRAAIENKGALCVLDFGGSLGSSYFQNKDFLEPIKDLKWCIVEQPHFVECGKKNFQNEQLAFYYDIEDCLTKHQPSVLLLSGVLAYLEKPSDWINKFKALNFSYIIVDRTAFIDKDKDILTVESIPLSMYKASYPSWFFNFDKFIELFLTHYFIIDIFDSFTDRPIVLNGENQAIWKGILFKKNNI